MMRRAIHIIGPFLLWPFIAFAQTDNIKLQLVNNEKNSFSPGRTINLVIRLVNNTPQDELVALTLKLPKGWKCFSELVGIQAPKEQATVKILSVNIPGYTPAGDYFITIEGEDSRSQASNEIELPVTVEPKYALKVELIGGAEYLFAGDTASVQFMIQNLSNCKVEFQAQLKGAGNDEKMDFALDPDSSAFITRNITPEKGIMKSEKRNISMSAAMANMPDVNASCIYSYHVIPGKDVTFDPFNRFPLQVSTFFVSDNPRGKRLYALMAEIEARDFLDERKTKLMTFRLRGPSRAGQPLYGVYDEYYMEYSSPKAKYMLGDHAYQLSYLTEFMRYGRGARAEHTFNHFKVGSFINFPRFYPNIKREFSAYMGYTFPYKLDLNFGYLNKLMNTGDSHHLMTFNGIGKPFKWAKLDWEYALGTFGNEYKQAVKTEVTLNFKMLNLFYNYTLAEKNFPGYFSDTRNMLANVNLNLTSKLNIGTNYSQLHQNMALDTLYGSAPISKNININLNYRVIKNGGLSAAYYYRERQDRMDPMLFNYTESSFRMAYHQRIKNIGFNLIGEFGQTENLLMPEEERLNAMYHGQVNINYQIFSRLSFSGFVDYQESKSYTFKDHKNWIYSASINGSISKKVSLYFKYQNSYRIEDYNYDRSLLDGRFVYAPDKNNRIEISSQYHLAKNTLDVRQLAFQVRYVNIFSVPVRKKKNIGKLAGNVINHGVNTVAGIVISIGSDQAVTDKEGNFSFPMLPAGKYFLMVDYSKAGVFAVPEVPGPYQVEILPGTESRFDIGLTEAGKIIGEIKILKDVADEDKTYAAIRDQMGKLLVEAKNGEEVYRIFTKDDGTFSFESLRPGPWAVKVYDRGIPKEYELVTGLFNVGLTSGETGNIEVQIKEVRRRIKFQTSVGKEIITSATPSKTALQPKNNADGLEYRIQIAAFARPLVSTDGLSEKYGITDRIKVDQFNGNHIYTIGSFKTQRAAYLRNTELQKNTGTTGSFIVSFRDGKRTEKLEKPLIASKKPD